MMESMKENNIKHTEIGSIPEELKPTLRDRFKVSRIGIFGSFARNEQREGSDEEELGRKVDVVTPEAISPYIKP